jgi:hypothetical protein
MTDCHNLKEGDVLVCEGCGLELKVVKACDECGTEEKECGCCPCTFACCDDDMKVKKAE